MFNVQKFIFGLLGQFAGTLFQSDKIAEKLKDIIIDTIEVVYSIGIIASHGYVGLDAIKAFCKALIKALPSTLLKEIKEHLLNFAVGTVSSDTDKQEITDYLNSKI